MCDARAWRPQLEAVADIAEPTVPDVGRAARADEFAREFLAAAPPRFALAGFSLGGILALEIMAQAGHRVTHLALVATNPRPLPAADAEPRRAAVALATTAGLRRHVADILLPAYLPMARQGDARLAGIILAMAESQGIEVFRRQTEAAIGRADSRSRLARIAVPALVVNGEEDRICPPDRARELAAGIAGATLVLLAGVGHFPTLEAPAAVSDALRRLLARA